MLSFALRLRLSRRADHGRAHRLSHSTEHHDTLGRRAFRFASLKSASHTPAAPPLGGAFSMRQLRQRADIRQGHIGAGTGRDRLGPVERIAALEQARGDRRRKGTYREIVSS